MKKLCIFLIVLGLLVGCTYYRVVDPASGKEYFTTKVKQAGKSGAVTIKDAKTGAKVTLQSTEVHKISKKEYEEGLKDRGEDEAPIDEGA